MYLQTSGPNHGQTARQKNDDRRQSSCLPGFSVLVICLHVFSVWSLKWYAPSCSWHSFVKTWFRNRIFWKLDSCATGERTDGQSNQQRCENAPILAGYTFEFASNLWLGKSTGRQKALQAYRQTDRRPDSRAASMGQKRRKTQNEQPFNHSLSHELGSE